VFASSTPRSSFFARIWVPPFCLVFSSSAFFLMPRVGRPFGFFSLWTLPLSMVARLSRLILLPFPFGTCCSLIPGNVCHFRIFSSSRVEAPFAFKRGQPLPADSKRRRLPGLDRSINFGLFSASPPSTPLVCKVFSPNTFLHQHGNAC